LATTGAGHSTCDSSHRKKGICLSAQPFHRSHSWFCKQALQYCTFRQYKHQWNESEVNREVNQVSERTCRTKQGPEQHDRHHDRRPNTTRSFTDPPQQQEAKPTSSDQSIVLGQPTATPSVIHGQFIHRHGQFIHWQLIHRQRASTQVSNALAKATLGWSMPYLTLLLSSQLSYSQATTLAPARETVYSAQGTKSTPRTFKPTVAL
jgi:hypothetical protein